MHAPSSHLPPPCCLDRPDLRLFGEVDEAMLERFFDQAGHVSEEADLVVLELNTLGGAADVARRLVFEIELMRRRLAGRFIFIGKTQVYSGGVTLMSAFPRADRYLTEDAELLIHCRQLDKDIEISGPMRASLPKLKAVERQIEIGMKWEDENFSRLIEGSDVRFEEIASHALDNWYLSAEEAYKRKLIAGILRPD